VNYPEIEVQPLHLRAEAYIIGSIPALQLNAQRPNGNLERPFALNLLGDGFNAARPLKYEELRDIRDWCERAMAAVDRSLEEGEVA